MCALDVYRQDSKYLLLFLISRVVKYVPVNLICALTAFNKNLITQTIMITLQAYLIPTRKRSVNMISDQRSK